MASGDMLFFWDSDDDRGAIASASRNGHLHTPLALTEGMEFAAELPPSYSGLGLTIRVLVAMTSAVANDIKVEAQFERIGFAVQDIDSDGFATAVDSGDLTVPGTSGHVLLVSISLTDGAQIDNLAAGEPFRLIITRIAVVGTDAAGDMQVLNVSMRET